jgi:hypothetical protein
LTTGSGKASPAGPAGRAQKTAKVVLAKGAASPKPATGKTAAATPQKAGPRKSAAAPPAPAKTRKAAPAKAPAKTRKAAPAKAPAKGGARKSTRGDRSDRSATTTQPDAATASRPTKARSRSLATPAKPVDHSALRLLGVAPGERVRFRRQAAGRWSIGIVVRRERDGSIGLTGPNGAARAIPIERIEVGCTGPRGAQSWEPLTIRASRSEQLRLL